MCVKVGAIAFLLLASGETEKWARKKETKVNEGEDIPLNQLNAKEKI